MCSCREVLATEGLVLSLSLWAPLANRSGRLLGPVVRAAMPVSVFTDLANQQFYGRLTRKVRENAGSMHCVQSTSKNVGMEHVEW